jgi:3-isopropylmalate/(R)-2-methylmalate dehydratase small subunit
MEPIRTIKSRTVVMPSTNIDTDQIIPARFLTTTTRDGLGVSLFADWRYDAAGNPRADFILNQPAAQGCRVLVAGRNIGCGSSREHAPWALLDYGFLAVISTEIAHPGAEVGIDLDSQQLALPDGREVPFPLESFARYCLMNGVDELGFLLSKLPDVERYERTHGK